MERHFEDNNTRPYLIITFGYWLKINFCFTMPITRYDNSWFSSYVFSIKENGSLSFSVLPFSWWLPNMKVGFFGRKIRHRHVRRNKNVENLFINATITTVLTLSEASDSLPSSALSLVPRIVSESFFEGNSTRIRKTCQLRSNRRNGCLSNPTLTWRNEFAIQLYHRKLRNQLGICLAMYWNCPRGGSSLIRHLVLVVWLFK